jgi:predicted metalloprotease
VSLVAVVVATMMAGQACGGEGSGGIESKTGAASSPDVDTTTLAGDARAAIEESERYWNEQLSKRGITFEPVRRIIPYTSAGEVTCGSEAMESNNAAYCSVGDFIAFDAAWAQQAYDKIGDAFLYYLLGHEYAHAVQLRMGRQYQYTIEQELQADCMAGAMIGEAVRNGRLQLEDGDIRELQRGLIAVADQPGQPWFAEGSHGTAEQRNEAFFAGYDGSLDACKL